MAEEAYAVYDVPSMIRESTEDNYRYKPSLDFDYDTGDFKLDGGGSPVLARGQEAYKQWCIKQVLTERYAHLAYSGKIGVDHRQIERQPEFDAQCSEIERQYTEALMANPKTEYVRHFTFSQPAPDAIAVGFTVKGREYDEESIEILIKKRGES